MTSSFADSDFQSALVESRRGITELKDIVAKRLTDDKADNPQLGFCEFLKVDVVQLTSDSYDEFQQEMFNLLMRLKWSDKQQSYHNRMGTPPCAARTQTNTQCHTSRCKPRRIRCHRHLHKYYKDIHSSSIYNIHSSTSNRHLHSHMHPRNSRSRARVHTINT